MKEIYKRLSPLTHKLCYCIGEDTKQNKKEREWAFKDFFERERNSAAINKLTEENSEK